MKQIVLVALFLVATCIVATLLSSLGIERFGAAIGPRTSNLDIQITDSLNRIAFLPMANGMNQTNQILSYTVPAAISPGPNRSYPFTKLLVTHVATPNTKMTTATYTSSKAPQTVQVPANTMLAFQYGI